MAEKDTFAKVLQTIKNVEFMQNQINEITESLAKLTSRIELLEKQHDSKHGG